MAEAKSTRDFGLERFLATGTITPKQVLQAPSGRAAVYDGTEAVLSGSYLEVTTIGEFTLDKTSGFNALKGNRAYWDHSADAVNYKKVNDRDFYVGRFATDSSNADNKCTVLLNEDPPYDIDIMRDPVLSVNVGTAAAGGFGYPVRLGGCHILELTATNEAQKCDLLSVDGFSPDSNAIVQAIFRIISDGSNATQDFTIGCASGTHASDFQSVAEFVAVSTVGNSTNINVQSDDGTTDVAPTDSTADYTEGSVVANRVEVWIDLRDKADAQVYVNGTLVLGSTTFTLAAATGPLFLIAHLEKTSSTDTYKVAVDALRAHFSEQ